MFPQSDLIPVHHDTINDSSPRDAGLIEFAAILNLIIET